MIRRAFRQVKREPFIACAFTVFAALRLHFEHAPLWTLPIAVAGWIAASCADNMWQAHLDARAEDGALISRVGLKDQGQQACPPNHPLDSIVVAFPGVGV